MGDRSAGGERGGEPSAARVSDESSRGAESAAPDRPGPHDASVVVEAGRFEWAPEELSVVFHTLAESRAKRALVPFIEKGFHPDPLGSRRPAPTDSDQTRPFVIAFIRYPLD